MAEQRWVFVLKAQDKPGALTAAAGVFSNRGVSLETILGSSTTWTGVDGGRIVLSFWATQPKQELLRRTLERLSAVLQVDCYAYSSPELRSIAVVRVPSSVAVDWQASEVQAEVISEDDDTQTLLLTGSTLAVDEVTRQLQEREALLDAALSVMAV